MPAAAVAALAIAQTVRDQDVVQHDDGPATLRQGVAKGRRISVEDAAMRHGRKSRSRRVDGYKRHVCATWTPDWSARSGLLPRMPLKRVLPTTCSPISADRQCVARTAHRSWVSRQSGRP